MLQWTLANEYPATSMPGEADVRFAALVGDMTRGRLAVRTIADARPGIDPLNAVASGRIEMADTFAGALAEAEPIFGFSTLPFVATDAAHARRLYDAARPLYDSAFARHNQRLVFSTPWPASGLWAQSLAPDPATIAGLAVRTYDEAGTRVFKQLGAKATAVPFAHLEARLASGETNAVLSSGDGGAGARLWQYLRCFTELNYAIPLSFTALNLDSWRGADEAMRHAIDDAAASTEAQQWSALAARVAGNYARMRENGVSIGTRISVELHQRLREAGRVVAAEWARNAGAEARALLELQ